MILACVMEYTVDSVLSLAHMHAWCLSTVVIIFEVGFCMPVTVNVYKLIVFCDMYFCPLYVCAICCVYNGLYPLRVP